MRLDLAGIPLQDRTDAAWRAVCDGHDPYIMLHTALWPNAVPSFGSAPSLIDGTCVNGHPWTEENTYVRPNGWRKCRACDRGADVVRPRERQLIPHGTSSGYSYWRCRCPECRAYHAAEARRMRRNRR